MKEVLKLLSGGPKGSPDGIIDALAITKFGLLTNDCHISASVEP